MNNLEAARKRLEQETFHQQWNYGILAGELERIATMFDRVSTDQRDELLAQFHDFAGRLPYANDSDYGALLLEFTADSQDDPELAQRLYREAFFRAGWCVQAATAGGEAIARSRDFRRIEAKIINHNAQPNVA